MFVRFLEVHSHYNEQDAEIGKIITEGPARDGANWYVYVANNPLRFVDPTGMLRVEGSQANDEKDQE